MNTGNPISTQQPATAHRVEFFRLPPPGKHDPFFGLSRGWYYKAAAASEIKMVAIRNRGAVRGVRLVAYDLVLDYVRRSMNAVKPASRHEPPTQPVAGQLGSFGSADACAKPAWVNPASNEVVLTDGHHLPVDFRAWTYSHALTAYRAQGSAAEESLLVLGEVAARSLARRQFYVANTRCRGAHRIYVSSKQQILARLQEPDFGRELATEFVERRHITMREVMSWRRLPRVFENLRLAIWGAAKQRQEMQETMSQRMEV